MIYPAPSQNHNTRTLPISMLVLHYTGMHSGEEALARLRDPNAKVSAHYLIEEDGRIFSLVDETRRAWHAGVSQWRGITDINSASIGIEIVNGGHDFGLPAYPEAQIAALIALCQDIVQRHNIAAYNLVGHSDIAPDRKQDPGEHFPWKHLADAGLGLWADKTISPPQMITIRDDLASIGYGFNAVSETEIFTAFQRHFLPQAISGEPCAKTRAMAHALARLIPAS